MALRNQQSPKLSGKQQTTWLRVGGAALLLSMIGFGVSMFNQQNQQLSQQQAKASSQALSQAAGQSTQSGATASQQLTTSSAASSATQSQSTRSQQASTAAQQLMQAQTMASAVQWGAIQTSLEADAGKLNWKTLFEQNSLLFEVQRSLDGENFETLGKLDAYGPGETEEPQQYDFDDPTIGEAQMPRVFYRVKQVGLDGAEHFSPTSNYDFGLNLGLYAKIEKVKKRKIEILYASDQADSITLRVVNPAGQPLETHRLFAEATPKTLRFKSKDWEPGAYFLQLIGSGGQAMEHFKIEE